MKNNIFFILIFLFAFLTFGQEKRKTDARKHSKMGYQRLLAMKMAFIVEKSELNTEEETFFWDIYKKYQDTIYQKHKEIKEYYKRDMAKMTEEECRLVCEKILQNEEDILKVKSKIYQDFKTKVSAKTILKIMNAEKMFDKKMIKKYIAKKSH